MEFEKLQTIIGEVLNIEPDEIIMGIEEEFDIEIPSVEAEKIVSVGDAVEQIKNALN